MISLSSMKQQAVQYAAKKYINDRYADLGSISKLEINPNSRTILAELNLNGEPEPIVLEVLRYQLLESCRATLSSFGGGQNITAMDGRRFSEVS